MTDSKEWCDGDWRCRSSSKPFAGAESGSPGRALEAGKRGSPGRAVQAGIRGKRLRGFANLKKMPKIQDNYVCRWVVPDLSRIKKLENHPKIKFCICTFRASMPGFLCTLLNVVSHYDLTVLSMSVIGFIKKLDM